MGGGGGSGRDLTSDELDHLQDKARKRLKQGDHPEKRNVFISFVSEDLQDVNLLRGQAKNESSDIEFIDHSLKEPIDSKKADYIKQKIREKIERSSVTVCFLSNNTSQSRWVDWEIRESIRLGKGIVAMYKGDTPPKILPSVIKEHGVKPVPWNQKYITNSIDNAAKDRG